MVSKLNGGFLSIFCVIVMSLLLVPWTKGGVLMHLFGIAFLDSRGDIRLPFHWPAFEYLSNRQLMAALKVCGLK